MLSRKQARENAFILIFEKSFNDLTVEELLETAKSVKEFETDEYIERVLSGVFEKIEKIDEIISNNAKGWKIERLSRVVLSLLRLAVYEITNMHDIPSSVSFARNMQLKKMQHILTEFLAV